LIVTGIGPCSPILGRLIDQTAFFCKILADFSPRLLAMTRGAGVALWQVSIKHLVSRIYRWTATSCRRSCQKEAVRPRDRRELGRSTQTVFALGTRRVSGLTIINRSSMNYLSRRILNSTREDARIGGQPGALRLPATDGHPAARG
jgi:hypothetical protein